MPVLSFIYLSIIYVSSIFVSVYYLSLYLYTHLYLYLAGCHLFIYLSIHSSIYGLFHTTRI